MKCIVELFGDDRNGRKMIAWGRRIGYVDAGHVFDAERRKIAQTFRPRFHSPCRFDILLPVMLRQSFTDFIFVTSTDGSGKVASYVRALDMLGPILAKHYPKPIVGGSVWHGFSLADIHAVLTRVPWGHRMLIIDKCHSQPEKALFYVRRTVHNGWSCDVLRNWLSTELYECEGKAQTNFAHRVRISSSMCEIPGSADHTGLLQVGAMSFKSTKKAFELTVNCAELKAAAKKRIDQQSGMAGIKYILHHAERAFRRGRWAVSISRFSRQKPSLPSATQCQSPIRRDCRFDVPRSREDCPSFNSLAQAASHLLLLHPEASQSTNSGVFTVHLQPNMCEMSSLNLL